MSHGRPRTALDNPRGSAWRGRRSAMAALVTTAVLTLALSSCASVGGTPTVPTVSTPSIAPTSTPATSAAGPTSSSETTASASSSTATSDTTSDSTTTTSAATTTRGAIPGVPHSTPLLDTDLIVSRKADDQTDLYIVDTTNGMVGDQITQGSPGQQYPTLSPDRGSIVYLQVSDDGNTLRMMAADGSGDRPLLAADADFCHGPQRPAWNPVDTSEIAVACRGGEEGNKLVLIGVDGTLRSTINTGLVTFDDPTYSPDGKTLAFWGSQEEGAGGGALYVQPANGSGTPKQITTPGARANDTDPMWSVDGESIIFRRATEDGGGGQSAQILQVNADGSALTPVSDGTAFDYDPSVAPDGRQVAFLSNRINAAGNNDQQVWVINIDGTGLRQIGIGKPGTAAGAPEWGRR